MKRSEALKIRSIIEKAVAYLNDADAFIVPTLFPAWSEDKEYTVGERVCYCDILYKCISAHISQADWTPDTAVSLWVCIDDPSVEYPDWRQPTGAHDAYAVDAKVTYNNKKWINTIDNNIYEPGVYGWVELT